MKTAVLFPIGVTDEWRERALDFTVGWYGKHLRPHVDGLFAGTVDAGAEWSKGAAIDNALEAADLTLGRADVLVLADADTFLAEPDRLVRALELVRTGTPYVSPHAMVYRLTERETGRIHEAGLGATPRLGHVCRPVYPGIMGGGITVLTREAFETVSGIDPRFVGWGGEDVAFGYALETLVAPPTRLDARLVHLWHPHPAPTLRGSPESERLVAAYTAAYGFPRMMLDVLATGEAPVPRPPLSEPVRFRMTQSQVHRIKIGATPIRFDREGIHETDDPDHADALRRRQHVKEIR